MRISLVRLKGLAFILWHARHAFYHILFGLVWAWMLRELWGQLNIKWVLLAVVGSLLPDAEHFLYFFTYGKKDPYTKLILSFLKNHEWRIFTVMVENGHKFNTNLTFHNVYIVVLLMAAVSVCFLFDWHSWTVFIGAMITHYLFDIIDDIVTLGRVNPNWKRWGRPKK